MTRPARRAVRIVAFALSMAASATLLLWVLPKLTGAHWSDIENELAGVPVRRLIQLVVVWGVGLYLNTFVLTAALPGLRRRRALALNLGGSGVSNVLPFGGAAGIGLNYAMLRSWGYDRVRVTSYAMVTNAATAVVKIVVAVAGLVALAVLPALRGAFPVPGPRTGGVVLVGFVSLAFLGAHGGAGWRAGRRLLPERGVERAERVERAAAAWWRHTVVLLRRRWPALVAGGFGYAATQLLLLWLCLRTVGAGVSLTVVAVAFAVDRLLTLVPITPGGAGVVETGVTAVLVALGGDAAASAAGVVLFRIFVFALEIPVGGAVALGWLTRHRTG